MIVSINEIQSISAYYFQSYFFIKEAPASPPAKKSKDRHCTRPPLEKPATEERRARELDVNSGASTSGASVAAKAKVKPERQTSLSDGVNASSGMSFAELMNTGASGQKKRRVRTSGPVDSAPALKRPKVAPAVTDADIRASLSQPTIDYCVQLDDKGAIKRFANNSSKGKS